MPSITYTFATLISLFLLGKGYATQLGAKEEDKPLNSLSLSETLTTRASDKKIHPRLLSPFMSMRAETEHIPNIPNIPFFQTDNPPLPSGYWGISQQEIDFLFENSSDYIAISGFDRFNKVNKALQEASGWSEEELISSPHGTFEQPDHVQEVKSFVKFMATRQSTFGFEAKAKRKDGSNLWIQWLTLAKIDASLEDEKDRTFFCIGRDITQKKEQESARIKSLESSKEEIEKLNNDLLKRNKFLQAISEIQSTYVEMDKLPANYKDASEEDVFFPYYKIFKFIIQSFIDLSESTYGFVGKYYFGKCRPPFLQQVFGVGKGLSLDDDIYKSINKYEGKWKKLCDFNNILGEIIRTKKPLIVNDIVIYKKPTGIPANHIPIYSILGIPLIFSDELVGVIVLANKKEGYADSLVQWLEPLSLLTGRIINEVKMEYLSREVEQEVIARKHAEASNAAKSVFLAHMSHEIRTPLTGILGLMDIINTDPLSDEDKFHFQSVQASGWDLMRVINDILDISKIETDQLKVEEIEFEISKVLEAVNTLLLLEAKKRDNRLTVTLNHEVPSFLIGDPARLRQILFNLIGNAIKFTEHGSVSVNIGGEKSIDEENIFCLKGTVSDMGIGMNDETLNNLFKPFYQSDESMMRQYGGTGLGLCITQKICKMMGGDIKVNSEYGSGSTFEFIVKMKLPEKHTQSTTAIYHKMLGSKKFSELRILVAEDERVCQLVLKTVLGHEGCTVTVVSNGLEAVEATKKEHYDLILMDGEMPVMSGLESTRQIRKMFNSQTLPIIGVTAHGPECRERFMASGMDGYLTKPVNKAILKAEILRCLEGDKLKLERLPKLNVLIAEDNLINQLVLKKMIDQEGCMVTVVPNGLEAVEATKKEHYDLILMDGEMPVMSGLEATRRIRQMFDYQTLPIIGITAHALDTHRERFLASGMNGYLTKPVEKNALKAEILRVRHTQTQCEDQPLTE
jgi:PAS domain S-box-containing protein